MVVSHSVLRTRLADLAIAQNATVWRWAIHWNRGHEPFIRVRLIRKERHVDEPVDLPLSSLLPSEKDGDHTNYGKYTDSMDMGVSER